MTNQETIANLNMIRVAFVDPVTKEQRKLIDDTFDNAIKALEPCDDAISRQAVLDLIEHYNSDGLGSVFYGYEEGLKFANTVNKLPPVNPHVSCEDAVSRQAVDTLVDELARAISDERCCISRGRSTATIMQDILELPPVNPQEPKTRHCKDCKWWKDSDGAFRRGIGAESQCPMNRIEVYEGNGYCYMFEPQERSE